MPLHYFKALPDRAGVKMGFWSMLAFILKMLPRIPAFYASREAVVDDRLSKVHSVASEHLPSCLKIMLLVYCCNQRGEEVREDRGRGVCGWAFSQSYHSRFG